MNRTDAEALARARDVLENPGLAIRLTDLVGRPVERAVAALPAAASRQIHRATGAALDRALSVALRTMDADPDPPANWLHRLAAGAVGAGGGAFGLAGLAVELPISTPLMLRAIADHARAQGEDLSLPGPRLECLAVFAYGSPRASDDAADAGYFAVRAMLARSVADAAEFLGAKGVARPAADRGPWRRPQARPAGARPCRLRQLCQGAARGRRGGGRVDRGVQLCQRPGDQSGRPGGR